MELLHTLVAFIVALGLLVTAHEYGHYWVARRLGVKILRFSIGFGRTLWRRQAGETEFVIAAVPLGGYVKMLDEREGEVAPAELARAFNRKSLGVRSAVVAAGPLANFLFAFAAYWLMLVIGVSAPRPIIGEVVADSIAGRAGIPPGAEIVEVDGLVTQTWDGVFRKSLTAILDDASVPVTVRDVNGGERRVVLDFDGLSIDDIGQGDFFAAIGVTPQRPRIPPVIDKVVAGEPAATGGMRAGDRVSAVDGVTIDSWDAWVEVVRSHPGRALRVSVERDGGVVELVVTPLSSTVDGATIGRIGAEVRVPEGLTAMPLGIERYAPLDALGGAARRTAEMSLTTLKFLYKMVVGEASVQNLSGPISIAHYAGESARLGIARFLEFLALVSVSLAVLNLLPIPLLDGGHLLYYLIESVTRRPVSEHLQTYGQQIGLFVLLGLMGLAVYNDILRML